MADQEVDGSQFRKGLPKAAVVSGAKRELDYASPPPEMFHTLKNCKEKWKLGKCKGRRRERHNKGRGGGIWKDRPSQFEFLFAEGKCHTRETWIGSRRKGDCEKRSECREEKLEEREVTAWKPQRVCRLRLEKGAKSEGAREKNQQ